MMKIMMNDNGNYYCVKHDDTNSNKNSIQAMTKTTKKEMVFSKDQNSEDGNYKC